MAKLKTLLASAALGAGLLLASALSADAAPPATPLVDDDRAPENCARAHARLASGDADGIDRLMGRVRRLLEAQKPPIHFRLVDGAPTEMGDVQLATYSVNGSTTLKAGMLHCAHGGTCNRAANLIQFRKLATPIVSCGPKPPDVQ